MRTLSAEIEIHSSPARAWLAPDRLRFTQREIFTGLLVPALRGPLRDTQKGFEAMNQALKERAEIYAS